MSDRNDEIRTAINEFDTDKARLLLRDAIKNNPDAETYYLASQVAISDDQRQFFLQKATESDPFHRNAHNALSKEHTGSPNTPATPNPPSPPSSSYITARVRSNARLYQLPHEKSSVVAHLDSDVPIIPLTRDESNTWLNAIYIGSTKREIVGWIETSKISDAEIDGQPVNLIELPITQYEFNSRSDLEKLAQILSQEEKNIRGPALKIMFRWIFIGLAVGFVLALITKIWFFLALVFVGEFIGILQTLPLGKQARNLRLQAKYFKNLKKSDAERLMEKQALLMAANTALHVGGTMVSRYIPNRSDVTIRRK